MRKAAAILALATLFGCGGTDVDVPPVGNLPEGRTIADRGEPDLQPFDLTVDRPLKRGRAPNQCDFTPPNLRFGIIPPGKSATLEVYFENRGPGPCLITDITVAEDVEVFGLTERMELLSGQGVRVSINLPARDERDEDWVVLSFRVNGEYKEMVLNAVEREPCAIVSPAALAFPPTGVGCTSEATLTVSNVCDEDLAITELTSDHAEITPVFDEALSLRRGTSAEIAVRYRPAARGLDAATLTLLTSDGAYEIYAAVDADGDPTDCIEP